MDQRIVRGDGEADPGQQRPLQPSLCRHGRHRAAGWGREIQSFCVVEFPAGE